jgi:hypothetical protein
MLFAPPLALLALSQWVEQILSYTLDAKSILWQNGAYVIIQMDPCVEAPFNDGVTCDSSTNFTNDSFFIQYMKVWKLVRNYASWIWP